MLSVVISGLANGFVYALVAIGFTLVYRTTGVLNFAQGAFVMIGGLGAWAAMDLLHLPYGAALVSGLVLAAVVAILVWALVVAPLKLAGAEGYVIILATLVVGVGLGLTAQYILGSQPQTIAALFPHAQIEVAGVNVSAQYLIVIGVGLAITAAFGALLKWSSIGRQMRACAANSNTAALLGVSYWWVGMWAFVLTGVVGAFGGELIAAAQFTSFDAGVTYGIFGFIGAMIGGLNSLTGAVVGGVIVGLVYSFVAAYLSSTYASVLVLVLLLVVLWVRPKGIVARRS